MPQKTSAPEPVRRRGRPPRTEAFEAPAKGASSLQTLDRGLQALALIAARPMGLTVAELANLIDVHRAIAYRLVATLEAHDLVARGRDGQVRLGAGMVGLAARFEPQLRAVAQPFLQQLADETSAAAFLAVSDGGACVAISVAEPQNGVLGVTYRVGSRHPLDIGAAGIAILSGRPSRADDPPMIVAARRDGYCVTKGAIQIGTIGVACPLHGTFSFVASGETSIGIIGLEGLDVARATHLVLARADDLRAAMNFSIDGPS